MKITIEIPEKEFIRAMRIGWNREYEEDLTDADFSLPETGDLTDTPQEADVMRAIPFLIGATVIRVQ